MTSQLNLMRKSSNNHFNWLTSHLGLTGCHGHIDGFFRNFWPSFALAFALAFALQGRGSEVILGPKTHPRFPGFPPSTLCKYHFPGASANLDHYLTLFRHQRTQYSSLLPKTLARPLCPPCLAAGPSRVQVRRTCPCPCPFPWAPKRLVPWPREFLKKVPTKITTKQNPTLAHYISMCLH